MAAPLVLLWGLLAWQRAATAQNSQYGLNYLGSWPGYLTGSAGDMALRGNYLYVDVEVLGSGPVGARLAIFDVLTPSSPVRVGSFDTTDFGRIAMVGQYVYLFKAGYGPILDLSNPTNPNPVVTKASFGGLADDSGLVRSARPRCRRLRSTRLFGPGQRSVPSWRWIMDPEPQFSRLADNRRALFRRARRWLGEGGWP